MIIHQINLLHFTLRLQDTLISFTSSLMNKKNVAINCKTLKHYRLKKREIVL